MPPLRTSLCVYSKSNLLGHALRSVAQSPALLFVIPREGHSRLNGVARYMDAVQCVQVHACGFKLSLAM